MGRKLIVSCKFGGEFQQGEYGVQYNGGEAYAIEVDEEISFDTFRARVVAKCGLNEKGSLIALKYYLPTNNTTLISLRDDSDMKIFVNLFKDSISSDIYVQKLDSGKNGFSTLESQSILESDNLQPKMLPVWRDAITGIWQMFEGVEEIIETNPGSHVVWETTKNDSFQSLFISFYAQIVGFKNGCRPLLLVDGTFRKEHYKVTAIDANNQMFPLAFSVVLGETRDNWLWFLSNLKIVVDGVAGLTITSYRHKGLLDTVLEVFPDCYHAVCMHHLVANLMNSLSGKVRKASKKIIKNLVYASANSLKAEIYARGCRFGHLTTNVAESFNGWILEARSLPPIAMVNKIREQLMGMFFTRREELIQWTKVVTPCINKTMRSSVLASLTCRISPSSSFLYEVNDGKIHSVNLETMTCTCKTWHTLKNSCIHVAKICEQTERSIMPYISPYFTTELWRLAYAETINPVPNDDMSVYVSSNNSDDGGVEDWPFDCKSISGSSQWTQVLPPNVRQRPGRPKRKRIESQPVDKRSLCCSRCHEEGHNRATCNKAI
ncbi:hypothetical protein BUALT_Bualt04G0078400 [Buddleja alternifolia]|uniref:SWIM-type domain-containing protein n=1 Tax=Buddleja alternifolia TaxID=168488 RepID=A0AAV6XTM8_9LAMI|nr:hypothetical protein BUALT_Bualt04G0078400 [Buddleja alternifolia]